MNDVGNALRMLMVLQNREWIKIEELAAELEVDERTVRRYRGELEKAGIYIDSRTGKYGGYRLFDNFEIGAGITSEEISGLLYIKKYLMDVNHIYKGNFASIVDKISSNVRNVLDNRSVEVDTFENHVSKEYKANFCRKMELEYLTQVREAIVLSRKIEIQYCSLTSGTSSRIVHPYATFQNRGDTYFLGFCESKREFRDFKICRISKLTLIDEKFDKKDIDIAQMLNNSIGIYKGREIKLKMIVYEPFAQIVREKIWVPEQKITDRDDNAILFEARMTGIPEIKSWILGMGPYVKVLEPSEVIEELKVDIEKMKNFYCAR